MSHNISSVARVCTEVEFTVFPSGRFTITSIMDRTDKKLVKITSVQWSKLHLYLKVKPEIQILNELYLVRISHSCFHIILEFLQGILGYDFGITEPGSTGFNSGLSSGHDITLKRCWSSNFSIWVSFSLKIQELMFSFRIQFIQFRIWLWTIHI